MNRVGAKAALEAEWRRRAECAKDSSSRDEALEFAAIYHAASTYAEAQAMLKVRAGVMPEDEDGDEDWTTNTEWPWPPEGDLN